MLASGPDQRDEFAALGAIRDPFDRLIVGAARALDAYGLVQTVRS